MVSPARSLDDVDDRRLLLSAFRAVTVVVGAFLLASLASAGAMWAVGVETFAALESQPLPYTVVQAVSFVGFIVAAVTYLAVRDDWEIVHVRRPALRDVAIVVGGVVALGVTATATSVVVSVIMAALESLFGVSSEFGTNAVVETGQQNPSSFLYMIPVALFLVGPGEELVFRGVVQGLFRRVIGVVPAVVVASLLFGLGHYFAISSGSAWTYLLTASVMGLVLGGLYEYSENIAVPVAIHGLWNASLFAINWVLVTTSITVPM